MSRDPRSKWPDPTDSALDRARAVAASYRALASEAAPDRCAALDRAAVELGEGWVVPRPEPDEWLTEEQAATLCGVAPATIRWWAGEPHINVWRHPDGYKLAELRAHQATVRSQRRRGIRG